MSKYSRDLNINLGNEKTPHQIKYSFNTVLTVYFKQFHLYNHFIKTNQLIKKLAWLEVTSQVI